MLQRGDSIGVFQVESRAQMAMLPRLKPQHFYDLVIEVAIVRPGPIQGDMVHPYLRRRQGREPVHYPSEAVRTVLERTLGIPIFQEQVIELAMVAAGFSAGEADQLRRAMAAWKKRGGLEVFEQKLISGMLQRGHDKKFAQRVFQQIKGFGEYGFPESHAASFALLVYVSAWLKCHEPAAFYCGLLNSLPMGFYSPAQLIQDAKRHNIEVLGIDINRSSWSHTLEQIPSSPSRQPALRLGFRLVKGLHEAAAEAIVAARQACPFSNVDDLSLRTGISQQYLGFLARAGALNSLSRHRHAAHWQVAGVGPRLPIEPSPYSLQPVDENRAVQQDDNPAGATDVAAIICAPTLQEDLLDDYRYTGLTLGPHPMQLLRQQVALRHYRTAFELESYRQGQMIRVAGLVTGRQRPGTASGVVFLTLEDETGNINVVVWASVMQRFRAALLQGQLLKIKGIVEREAGVIHVVAGFVEDASDMLRDMADDALPFKSRDFH